jgi:hypothetical protein
MTKTIRYIHIPYCRNWSEIERLVSDSWIAIRGNTDTNNLRFFYMKLIVWWVRGYHSFAAREKKDRILSI